MGWYITIPDFEGPLTSFTEGVQSGHAVIDSVRASLDPRFGLTDGARYALWGYSGGSLASEWAAELQIQYAPELSFAGAALGGLVSNVSSIYSAVTGTRWAALIPESLLGMTSQYPKAHEYLVSQIRTDGPFNKTGFFVVKDVSIEEAFQIYAGQEVAQYFHNNDAVWNSPIIQAVVDREGQMGFHGIPQM